MLTVLAAVFPVFALIGMGAGFGRLRRIGPVGIAALNGFTVWLALPALLFRSLSGASAGLFQPGFLVVFGGSAFALFVAACFTCLPRPAAVADRALAALAAAYSNTAFIGIPLLTALLGSVGTQAAILASILTVSILFAIAVLIVEIAQNSGAGPARAVGRVAFGLLRNPLVLAPALGGLWAWEGLALPVPLIRLLDLLGAAASPCALVTIGAFLALPGQRAETSALVRCLLLKLIGQPLLAASFLWMATRAGLAVPHDWAVAAILLAALPTGTGPFMLAELYTREAALASRTILLSTVIGAVTVSLLASILLG